MNTNILRLAHIRSIGHRKFPYTSHSNGNSITVSNRCVRLPGTRDLLITLQLAWLSKYPIPTRIGIKSVLRYWITWEAAPISSEVQS